MLVSVVIPTFNGCRHLAECVPLVLEAARAAPGPVEVIVVDDASTDGTAEFCRGRWPQVRLVELSENRGFARAANRGIAQGSGEWVALLNDDAAADRDWIAAAARHFNHEKIGAVASLVVSAARPDVIETAGDGYTVAGVAFQRMNGEPARKAFAPEGGGGVEGRGAPPAQHPGLPPDRPAARRPAGVTVAGSPRDEGGAGPSGGPLASPCGAAAFYRREALDEAGGLAGSFECYYDDVDLGLRLRLLGWGVAFEPGSICSHEGGSSYGHRSWKQVKNSARNSEVVFFSCMPRRLLLAHLHSHVLAGLGQAFLRLSQRRLTAFLAGKVSFLRMLPAVLRRRRQIQASARLCPAEFSAALESRWIRRLVLGRLRRAPAERSRGRRTLPLIAERVLGRESG